MKQRSPLLVIFLTIVLDLIGFGLVIPLLPFYAQDFGASSLAIGALTATFSISQLIFTPIFGAWSDRIGRRPVILIALLFSSLSFTVGGLAGALWVLFLARAVNGVASSTMGVAQAYIADITTPENRAKGMGLLGAAFGIGFVIGPAIGGTLGHISRSLPFFIAAGLALTNCILGFFLLPESLTPELRAKAIQEHKTRSASPFNVIQRIIKALARPELRTPILIFFFFNVSFTAFEVVLPLFTQRRYGYTSIENGYLFAYIGVLVVIMQGGVIGKVVKRWGETQPLRLGLFILTITIALIPLGNWLLLLLAVLFILSIGEGITTPTSTAIISLSSGASEQGGVLGLSQGISSLARIIGPLIGGLFFELEGETWPFIVAGLIMGIALILSLGLQVVSKPNSTTATVGAKH